jgi:hypothetical protein
MCKPGIQAGKTVAELLAGAWRRAPPPLDLSQAVLAAAAPRLLETGGAALGWWRVRQSNLRTHREAVRLQQAYRLHSIQAALHEDHVRQAVQLLRSAGVEPLLAKGWACARLYPEPGLRPFGDVDLFVRPEQYSDALAALKSGDVLECAVDLHRGVPDLADRPMDELYGRSQLIELGDTDVRTLGCEDHLRHLCMHLLRHGAWRPLWLCDVAAALESRPADFDWELCLYGSRQRADWVACALGLAHQLLGASVDGTPVVPRAECLPRWLVPAVLRQWGFRYRRYTGRPMGSYLRHPAGLFDALRVRWPNAIEATISMRGNFNELPRLVLQVADGLVRTGQFLTGPFRGRKEATSGNFTP